MAEILSETTGFQVFIVIRDSCVRDVCVVNGVTIITITDRLFRIRRFVSEHLTILPKFPWIRIRHFHLHLLWQVPFLLLAKMMRSRPKGNTECAIEILDRTGCDVYCCLGISDRSREIFRLARANSRKTALFIASNADLENHNLKVVKSNHSENGQDMISLADAIVCQTKAQQKDVLKISKLNAELFANPINLDNWSRVLQSSPPSSLPELPDRFVLWIGRSDAEHKRPQVLLKIAEHCVQINFVMIMNTHDEVLAAEIRRNAPANVLILERVAAGDMPHFFARATMLVSTGSKRLEGFPNVFLQASASSVPIVSLEVDPGFVERQEAGLVCQSDPGSLEEAVKILWNDPKRAMKYGENGNKYVRQHHDVASSRSILIRIIGGLMKDGDSHQT